MYGLVESVRALFLEGGDIEVQYPKEPIANPVRVDWNRDGLLDHEEDVIPVQARSKNRIKSFNKDHESYSPTYNLPAPIYRQRLALEKAANLTGSKRFKRSLGSTVLSQLVRGGITAWRSELFSPHQTISQVFGVGGLPVAKVPYGPQLNFTLLIEDVVRAIWATGVGIKEDQAFRLTWLAPALDRMRGAMDQLENYVSGLHDLMHGQISPFLVNPNLAEQGLNLLESTLGSHGLEASITQLAEFYKLPTSLIAFRTGTVELLVHVPAHRSSTRLLSILQYIPSPIKLADHRYVVPHPAHQILVVSSDKTLFREMDLSELSLCEKEDEIWHCDHANYLQGQDPHSCLQALYLSDPQRVVKSCRVNFVEPANSLIQLNFNNFLLFHNTPQSLDIECPKKDKKPVTFSGLRQITLPAGCLATSGSFSFEGTLATEREHLRVTKKPLDLSIAFNSSIVKDSEIDHALAAMDTMVKEEGRPISFRHIEKLTTERYWDRVYSALYMTLAIITAIYSLLSSLWWGTSLPERVDRIRRRERASSPEDDPDTPFEPEVVPLRGFDSGSDGGFISPRSVRKDKPTGCPAPMPRYNRNYNIREGGILRSSSTATNGSYPMIPPLNSYNHYPSELDVDKVKKQVEKEYPSTVMMDANRSVGDSEEIRGEPSKYDFARDRDD